MGIRDRVLRFLSHTRVVPTPLYRLMVMAWGVAGLLSLAYGAPTSVRASSAPLWFDWVFVILQVCAAVTVLTGLYLVEENTHHASKLNRSLTLELVGIIELEVVIAWQIAATTFYQERVPSAGPTWMALIFGTWILFRVRDILRTQRRLGSTP